MAVSLSTAVRNARLNAIEATIGTGSRLRVLTGSMPANTAASDTGTVVATIDLPSDWMADAAGGSKAMQGTWADTSADAAGTAGYFRIYGSDNTCHIQGTVAENWTTSKGYSVGQNVVSSGGLYRCTTAGTSAASGNGPTGNGNAIADGSVAWTYAGAGSDMLIDNTSFNAGQNFQITSFVLTDGNG